MFAHAFDSMLLVVPYDSIGISYASTAPIDVLIPHTIPPFPSPLPPSLCCAAIDMNILDQIMAMALERMPCIGGITQAEHYQVRVERSVGGAGLAVRAQEYVGTAPRVQVLGPGRDGNGSV